MAKPMHTPEGDLALFISGDVSLWKSVEIKLHLAACETCRARIDAYKSSRQRLKDAAAQLPEGADWDRLAAEMTANIRVGLAAGECVAPRRGKRDLSGSLGFKSGIRPALLRATWPGNAIAGSGWKTVAAWSAAGAGIVAVLSAAWVLNLGTGDGDSLSRSMHALFQNNGRSGAMRSGAGRSTPNSFVSGTDDRGAVVEASADGVEERENGIPVSIPQASTRPVAITVSAPGSASARYVDDDTGQMTISTVYVQ